MVRAKLIPVFLLAVVTAVAVGCASHDSERGRLVYCNRMEFPFTTESSARAVVAVLALKRFKVTMPPEWESHLEPIRASKVDGSTSREIALTPIRQNRSQSGLEVFIKAWSKLPVEEYPGKETIPIAIEMAEYQKMIVGIVSGTDVPTHVD